VFGKKFEGRRGQEDDRLRQERRRRGEERKQNKVTRRSGIS
jgi:hypothetical protein